MWSCRRRRRIPRDGRCGASGQRGDADVLGRRHRARPARFGGLDELEVDELLRSDSSVQSTARLWREAECEWGGHRVRRRCSSLPGGSLARTEGRVAMTTSRIGRVAATRRKGTWPNPFGQGPVLGPSAADAASNHASPSALIPAMRRTTVLGTLDRCAADPKAGTGTADDARRRSTAEVGFGGCAPCVSLTPMPRRQRGRPPR